MQTSVSVGTAIRSVEALDRMSINDKLAHFARKDAFRLPRKPGEDWGAPMRFERKDLPHKLGPGGINVPQGNVMRQAYAVICRPCHGIPTARLVHGREHIIRKNGKLAFARCGECPIKASCQFIVEERLNANERIREARREFQRRGGVEAFWSNEPSRSRAVGSALQTLVRELQAASITTVNDAAVAAHYDQRAKDRRQADAERQRALRNVAGSNATNVPGPQASELLAKAKALRQRIETAQGEPGCPRWLVQLDAADAARIWAVRAALAGRAQKHGAAHIANALAKATPGVAHDALRFRVARVLKRLTQIEALK